MTVVDGVGAAKAQGVHPSYRSLPTVGDSDYRHAWNEFGRHDRLGSLNRLDAKEVVNAASLVLTGETFPLDLAVGEISPPLFGRRKTRHTIEQTARNFFEDKLDDFYLQASSQWDGFGHIRFKEHGFWQGRLDEPTAGGELGIDAWGERGIVGRGVLLDVAAYRHHIDRSIVHGSNETIAPEDLKLTAEHFGVTVEPGDILCVRTGWMTWYRGLSDSGKASLAEGVVSPGLAGTEAMAELLWDWQVAAIAADNPAVEPAPGTAELHRRLIPLLGFAVGELFDLDGLAASAHSDGRYEFLFTSAPLRIPGGLGSPANALALR